MAAEMPSPPSLLERTMQAVVQDRFGSPTALTISEVAPPQVGEHDVLVGIHASAVTHADRRIRAGDFPGIVRIPAHLAMGVTGPRNRPGTMFAGRVVEVGPAVTRFRVGDDVFGSALEEGGAYAERIAVPEDRRIARMPAGLRYDEAAALPYGAVTALIVLRDLARVQSGEKVAILGASGGVGAVAVQVARHLGAEVTAVCSAEDADLVRSLGAHHVVDYRTEDYRTGQYDVILDTVGASNFGASRRALTPNGRYLSLVVSARLLFDVLVTALIGGQRVFTSTSAGTSHHLEDVREMVERGALRPVVGRAFPLARVGEAHAHHEAGRTRGTVVLTVAGAPALRLAAPAA
jgi:NADPH:quinone reductase-like Zn-dependent oxidoreductase